MEMRSKNLFTYFGYGANKSAEMINAITGEKPKGYSAVLYGYKLCIQSLKDIPPKPRSVLSFWGKGFRSYIIVKENNSKVNGTLWFLSRDGLRHADKK